MSTEPGETYVCTRCGIEVSLGGVCPKCHSRASLVPASQAGAAPAPIHESGRRSGWRGLRIAVVILLAGGLAGGVWWAGRTPSEGDHAPEPAASASTVATPGPASDRVFGRPPPPRRLTPPPPPRLCGERYRLSVRVRFPHTSDAAPHARPAPRPAPRKVPDRPAPRQAPGKTPESATTQQRFLLTPKPLRWVLLSADRALTLGKRSLPVFRLGPQGALLPDPRHKRMVRRGFHDPLTPGLRPSDLVGHCLALLARPAEGGLTVRKPQRSEPWVRQLVGNAVAVVSWLTPRPPRPAATRFSDDRRPPPQVAPGVKELRRWFRRARKPPAAGQVRYRVTSAPGGVRVKGTVDTAPGALLPRHATLTLTNLPKGKLALQEVVLELVDEGSGCNRK